MRRCPSCGGSGGVLLLFSVAPCNKCVMEERTRKRGSTDHFVVIVTEPPKDESSFYVVVILSPGVIVRCAVFGPYTTRDEVLEHCKRLNAGEKNVLFSPSQYAPTSRFAIIARQDAKMLKLEELEELT